VYKRQSQFLEASQILESRGLSFKDIKNKTSKELNEIFGINKAIKGFVSKSIWSTKLQNNKETLKTDLMNQLEKTIEPLIERRKKLSEDDDNGKLKIEAEIVKQMNQIQKKLVGLKSKELYRRIEDSDKLADGDRYALKYTWEVMAADVKVDILRELMDKGLITDDGYVNKLQKNVKEKKVELEKMGAKAEKEREENGGEDGNKTVKDVNNALDGGLPDNILSKGGLDDIK
jgi:hypothetical protein